MGQEIYTVGYGGNIRESEREVGMLGRIQVMTRWADELVQDLKMLGRRQAIPWWAEDLVRWLSQGL